MASPSLANKEVTESTDGAEFSDEDGFADDDLLSPSDVNPQMSLKMAREGNKSFLERDNFETEFGTTSLDDPFSEDFSDIASYEIIDLFCEGDLVGRPVIVVYAYRMPSNKEFDHFKLLRYIQFTVDKVVDLDYSILYFHYGLRSNNKPPIAWLFRVYKILDRRYKKNLKALYVVHPTKFIRFLWVLFKPIISLKFQEKMHYVNSLKELNIGIPFSQLNLPQPIIDHDNHINSNAPGVAVDAMNTSIHHSQTPPRPTQQFNVTLRFILDHNPQCDVPPIVTYLTDFLRAHGMNVEGIFRRSGSVATMKALQAKFDLGESVDFMIEFNGDEKNAAIHASVLLKTFLRSLGEPVITNALYPELALMNGIRKEQRPEAFRRLIQKLPSENLLLLKTVVLFLTEVAENSAINLMDANNLSVVFGPNLTWPTDQQVPITQLSNLNNFCFTLIKNFDFVFGGN